MVHANYSNASNSADKCIRRVSTLFEQVGPNATADLALGRDRTEMSRFQCWWCSILWTRDWASKDSLKRAEPGEKLIRTGRHDGSDGAQLASKRTAEGV